MLSKPLNYDFYSFSFLLHYVLSPMVLYQFNETLHLEYFGITENELSTIVIVKFFHVIFLDFMELILGTCS